MGDKIHVKDLHTRDVCIVPWEKEQKYFSMIVLNVRDRRDGR